MQYTVENKEIKITVDTFGAELLSIVGLKSGLEYLWGGNPEYWASHAPVLFPVVGRLNEGKYKYEGNTYDMVLIHGFARHEDFTMIERRENYVLFELTSNAELMKKYPFEFVLKLRYTIEKNTLHIDYIVENKDNKDLLFSIGAHPGFNCPLTKNEKFSDYYLEFNEKETLGVLKMNEKIQFLPSTRPFLNDQNIIPLDYSLFAKDALVFQGLKSNSVCLKSNKHKNYLKFDFEGFPYLAFWTKENAPYICIEPWYGLGDYEGFDGELKDKIGIMSLPVAQKFECRHSITLFE